MGGGYIKFTVAARGAHALGGGGGGAFPAAAPGSACVVDQHAVCSRGQEEGGEPWSAEVSSTPWAAAALLTVNKRCSSRAQR